MSDQDWPADQIERLRELWAEGYSTAEIGRHMGRSKNSIIGKAHRIGLEARPSPITRSPDGVRKEHVRRAPKTTLPPLVSEAARPPLASQTPAKPLITWRPTLVPPPVVRTSRSLRCPWLLASSTKRTPVACDQPVELRDDGRPRVYCPEHCTRAFEKPKVSHLASEQA